MRWFKPLGVVFLPISTIGWGITILGFAFCVQVFVAIDHHSHSVSETLYGVFPFWAPTLLSLAWIADRTGGRTEGKAPPA